MQSIGKILKSNKGFSLIAIMMYFLILSIIVTASIFVTTSYVKQVINQREAIQAYYLAFSGTELAYSALLKDDEDLLYEFRNNSSKTLHQVVNESVFNGGMIELFLKTIEDNEKLLIESVGTTAVGRSYTLYLTIYVDVPNVKKYSN